MGKSSSSDLRVRTIGEIERGQSCRAAARRFGVAPATAVRLARRKAETGSLAPSRQGRPAGSGRLAAHVATLVGWVEAEGDITMPELAARLLAEKAVTVHPASLSRFMRVHGFRFRKTAAGDAHTVPLLEELISSQERNRNAIFRCSPATPQIISRVYGFLFFIVSFRRGRNFHKGPDFITCSNIGVEDNESRNL